MFFGWRKGRGGWEEKGGDFGIWNGISVYIYKQRMRKQTRRKDVL